MLYCTYDTLNMFRAILCPSSEALDYMYAIGACGVQCLAAGCQGQVQGSRVCVQEEGSCTTGLVKWYRGGEWLVGIELLMMGIEVPETC